MNSALLKPDYQLFEQAVQQRGITRLIHFTPMLNLISIAQQQALLSVSELEKFNSEHWELYLKDYIQSNDNLRLDGMRDHINISIEHPNELLFTRFREKYANAMFSPWCVLALKPELLWHEGTLLSVGNAASRASRVAGFDGSFSKFETLFAPSVASRNVYGSRVLTREGLAPSHPTDVQAEVLVPKRVPVSMITALYFEDQESMIISKGAFSAIGLSLSVEWGVLPSLFQRRC